jgi:hypothetical protein
MLALHWLLALSPWHWRNVRRTGILIYQDCACGRRRLRHTTPNRWQPIDWIWLETGQWSLTPEFGVWRPKRGPTKAR